MEKLEYFNLNNIPISHNFLIFGDIKKIQLFCTNIRHVLSNKNCVIDNVSNNKNKNKCVKYYSNEYCSNKYRQHGYLLIYDTLEEHPKSFSPLDTIFIHSQYINKESIMKQFLGNQFLNDLIKYYGPETFFVLQTASKIKSYEAETCFTHSLDFNDKPYDYNNIIRLNNIILNNCSIYHKINEFLYKILQSRLYQLNKIYCGNLCLKNYEILLPNELNFEIIKLFVLLYL